MKFVGHVTCFCVLCVDIVCGYTCHEDCYKKTHKKCEGKGRSKPIPEYNPKVSCSLYLNI